MPIQAISGIRFNFDSKNKTNSNVMPRISKNQIQDTVSFKASGLEKKLLRVNKYHSLTIDKILLDLMGIKPKDSSLKIALKDNDKLLIGKSFGDEPTADVALTKRASSRCMHIPRVILDLLGINPERNMVKLDFNDGKLILAKGSDIKAIASKSKKIAKSVD